MMKLKLRTQFAILTIAVTLFPLVFGLLFFTGQQAKRDPRVTTRLFIDEVAKEWILDNNISLEDIRSAGERVGLPIMDAALVDPDGTVRVSSFRDLPVGIKLDVIDLARPPLLPYGKPKPELRFLPIDASLEKALFLFLTFSHFYRGRIFETVISCW